MAANLFRGDRRGREALRTDLAPTQRFECVVACSRPLTPYPLIQNCESVRYHT